MGIDAGLFRQHFQITHPLKCGVSSLKSRPIFASRDRLASHSAAASSGSPAPVTYKDNGVHTPPADSALSRPAEPVSAPRSQAPAAPPAYLKASIKVQRAAASVRERRVCRAVLKALEPVAAGDWGWWRRLQCRQPHAAERAKGCGVLGGQHRLAGTPSALFSHLQPPQPARPAPALHLELLSSFVRVVTLLKLEPASACFQLLYALCLVICSSFQCGGSGPACY